MSRLTSPLRPLFVLLIAGATFATAPATAAVASAAATDAAALHLRLTKSEPAIDTVLTTAPTILRLWFSLPPELAVTTVKVAGRGGRAVTVGRPRRGSGQSDPVEVDVSQSLAPGVYVVTWKTSSRDGHPMTGTFSFTVKGGAS